MHKSRILNPLLNNLTTMKKTQFAPKAKETGILPEIDALDFTRLKYKLMRNDEGDAWSFEMCEEAEIEYKRYLTLIKLYPEKKLVPTKLMDKFWHQHILDTKAYQEDCNSVFGFFIHHFPYFGIYGKADEINLQNTFEETKVLYRIHFGEDIEKPHASRCQDHACHVQSECACRVSGACNND